MPPRGRGYVTNKKIDKKSLARLLKYVFKHYYIHFIIVMICIILNSVSNVIVNSFMAKLIDTVILPGMENGFATVVGGLRRIITYMIIFDVLGILGAALYPQIMARVGQGTIKSLRDDMFDNMETLPIRYFDSHTHGEIMSTYTNDVDTIRQLVGSSLPSLFQSIMSITMIFTTMLRYSIWMSLVVVAVVFMMFKITGKFGGKSARYMKAQQESLAEEEGFIEEMMEGMKVVKVFTHEEEAKADFDRLNEDSVCNQTTPSRRYRYLLFRCFQSKRICEHPGPDHQQRRQHHVCPAGGSRRRTGSSESKQPDFDRIYSDQYRCDHFLPGSLASAVADGFPDLDADINCGHGTGRKR